MLHAQDVRVDPRHRRVWRGDEEILLARKEFDLLVALISRAGVLVTREELMNDVWNTTFWTSSKTIDVHLGWIRRKLGDDSRRPSLITTVRGKGLRFETAPPTGAAPVVGPVVAPDVGPVVGLVVGPEVGSVTPATHGASST